MNAALGTIVSATAWLVFGAALAAVFVNARVVLRRQASPRRYLRLLNSFVALYIALLYLLLGAGLITISVTAALLGRVAILMTVALLTAEAIADR